MVGVVTQPFPVYDYQIDRSNFQHRLGPARFERQCIDGPRGSILVREKVWWKSFWDCSNRSNRSGNIAYVSFPASLPIPQIPFLKLVFDRDPPIKSSVSEIRKPIRKGVLHYILYLYILLFQERTYQLVKFYIRNKDGITPPSLPLFRSRRRRHPRCRSRSAAARPRCLGFAGHAYGPSRPPPDLPLPPPHRQAGSTTAA